MVILVSYFYLLIFFTRMMNSNCHFLRDPVFLTKSFQITRAKVSHPISGYVWGFFLDQNFQSSLYYFLFPVCFSLSFLIFVLFLFAFYIFQLS